MARSPASVTWVRRQREPAEGSQPFHCAQAGIGDLSEIEVEMRQCSCTLPVVSARRR